MLRSLLFFVCILLLLSQLTHADNGNKPTTAADASNEPPNLREKSLILVKIWCLILVFFATFLAGISPYFLKWSEWLLVLGTQFAGGVFLGTALMHFLSDSNETFGDLTEIKYPFAFTLACGGYLLIMISDCVISYVYGKQQPDAPRSNGDLEIQGISEQAKEPSQLHCAGNAKTSHSTHTFTTVSSFGDTILLISALCFHSVFEGIAIGVSDTKLDAWKTLWTICLHKLFAAIAMSIALLRMIPDRPFLSCVAYAFAFAISSPVGVAVGIIIDATTQDELADWIFAVTMGLACGIFIYVSINHLLSKGFTPSMEISVDKPHYKLLAVVLGIGVIAIVMIWDT